MVSLMFAIPVILVVFAIRWAVNGGVRDAAGKKVAPDEEPARQILDSSTPTAISTVMDTSRFVEIQRRGNLRPSTTKAHSMIKPLLRTIDLVRSEDPARRESIGKY